MFVGSGAVVVVDSFAGGAVVPVAPLVDLLAHAASPTAATTSNPARDRAGRCR
jgi:hypothetical protein